ncbi:MAG: hypothetical protein K9M84_13145 [Spirochaetia bacterium]|nr:hypothetical protein [Spirochaetia bacterium]MCF7942553.1 hypothetical protein [Spirochaetia bacterium]
MKLSSSCQPSSDLSGFLVCTREGVITLCSASVAELFPYAGTIHPGDQLGHVFALWPELVEASHSVPVPTSCIISKPTGNDAVIHAELLFDQHEESLCIHFKRSPSEQVSQQQDHTVLRVLSHDVREPFSLMSHLTILLQAKGEQELPEYLMPVLEEIALSCRKSEQVLEAAKLAIESRRDVPAPELKEILTLTELLKAAEPRVIGYLKAKDVTLQITPYEELPIIGDRQRLIQALHHLLLASAILSEPGRSIAVEQTVSADSLELIFRITGSAIPPELARIITSGTWGTLSDRDIGVNAVGLALHTAHQLLKFQQVRIQYEDGEQQGTSLIRCIFTRYRRALGADLKGGLV